MPPAKAGEEHVFNYSHVAFKDYVAFMEDQPGADDPETVRAWNDDWRRAHDHLEDLRIYEAAAADDVPMEPLPAEMAEMVERVHGDPIYKRSFMAVPVEIGMVELDRLIVWQTLVSLEHTDRLKRQLQPEADAETLFRFCLPYDHPMAEHRSAKTSDHSFVFTSRSTDLRFLDAVLLRPNQLVNYPSYGPIAGVVALVVGYGSNYLNAIATEGRIVLNNGNHRAYALRALGITHAPCLIQKVDTREELAHVATGGFRRHPDFYLTGPRPPLLKDYFDPLFHRKVVVPTTGRQIRVSFSTEESDLP